MEAFLAQSPDVARLRAHMRAAVFALGMTERCLRQPGPESATTADFHHYLASVLHELEAAGALVPAG